MKKYPLIFGIISSCLMVIAIILNIVAKFHLLLDSFNGIYENSNVDSWNPLLLSSQILSYISIGLVIIFASLTLWMSQKLQESQRLVIGLMLFNVIAGIISLVAMIVSIFTTFLVQFVANSLIVITIVTTVFAYRKILKCGEYYQRDSIKV